MSKKEIKSYINWKDASYIEGLEEFYGHFCYEVEQKNKEGEFGCNLSDEELAKELKEKYWKDEWLSEYRNKQGELTELFFEDVNEDREYVFCDGCDKWGGTGMNYTFEADFYCDMCVVRDMGDKPEGFDLRNHSFNSEYCKDWKSNVDELIESLKQYKVEESKRKAKSDAEFYELMSKTYGEDWTRYKEKANELL
jgi:hypothetical protein